MESVFKYTNSLDEPINFILEPWAEEFALLPNEELMLVGTYDQADAFCHVDHLVDCVVFYAWEHSLVRVYIDNIEQSKTSSSIRF